MHRMCAVRFCTFHSKLWFEIEDAETLVTTTKYTMTAGTCHWINHMRHIGKQLMTVIHRSVSELTGDIFL